MTKNIFDRAGWKFLRFEHKGKSHRIACGTKSQAAAEKMGHKALADKGEFLKQRERDKTAKDRMLDVWVEKFIDIKAQEGRRDIKTRSARLRRFSEHFSGRALADITRDDIEAWRHVLRSSMSQFSRGFKDATVRHYMMYSSGCMQEAKRRGLVDSNPFEGVEKPRARQNRPRYLPEDERDRLCQAAEGWLGEFLFVDFETGMRLAEMCNLLKTDIDRINCMAVLRYAKGNKPRSIPLSLRAQVVIDSLFNQIRHPYLFSGPDGKPLVRGWQESNCGPGLLVKDWHFQRSRGPFKKALEGAGIEDFTIHDARDTALTEMAMCGVSPHVIQKVAGHADLSTTQRYLDIHPDFVNKEMEKFNRRGEGTG